MKGILFLHLRTYLERSYPTAHWNAVLSDCAIAQMFNATWDYPDTLLSCIVEAAARRIGLPEAELWRRYGWFVIGELRKTFRWFFDESNDSRSFFRSIDRTHAAARKELGAVLPPSFDVHADPNGPDLLLVYVSKRRLLDFLRGCVDAVLDIYGECAEVTVAVETEDSITLRIAYR